MSNIENCKYMQLAIEQAKKGTGSVQTNPLVGCIIVKNNEVIGKGYHAQFGQSHAEVKAIKSASKSVEGAIVYVTLEPCGHFGKTPPCAHLLVNSKVSKVVIGAEDPTLNPEKSGINYLRKHGISVVVMNSTEAIKLIEPFLVNKQNNRSYITLKLATSIDFKTATSANKSKWITGEKTREFSQQMRSKYQAIAVGVETIISDDPELNNRVNKNTYQPIKIVFDTNLRTPLQSKIFNQGKVIILTGPNQSNNNYPNSVKIIECKVIDQKIDLLDATQKLFDLGIGTILVEGGSKLISSFVWNDLYDEIDHFIAPKIIGESSNNAFNARAINLVSESTQLEIQKVQKIQEDIYINYRRRRCLQD